MQDASDLRAQAHGLCNRIIALGINLPYPIRVETLWSANAIRSFGVCSVRIGRLDQR
jgi:hypothetical protein